MGCENHSRIMLYDACQLEMKSKDFNELEIEEQKKFRLQGGRCDDEHIHK